MAEIDYTDRHRAAGKPLVSLHLFGWLITAVVAVLFGVSITLHLHTRPTVCTSKARHDMIGLGMTQDEVEAILGGPPGHYTGMQPVVAMDANSGMSMCEGMVKEWWGSEGLIQVSFDERGTVLWTRFVEVSPMQVSFVSRLWWWLWGTNMDLAF